MKGYKAFNKDLECRGFQYEIGKTYELEDELQICKNGFHFCKNIKDCYSYYLADGKTRICEIEALGKIRRGANKFCTDKIKIIKEITDSNIARCNTGAYNTGYFNAGDCNNGARNTGDYNSGNSNSGFYNTGHRNTGSCNTGCCNVGGHNSGGYNVGNCNAGEFNVGHCNIGGFNTGSCNSGNNNSRDYNSGNYNTGYCNSGNCNSGDYNCCNHSSGIFNTKESTIKIFDKESEWTYQEWFNSDACVIMGKCPKTSSRWVEDSEMTDEEKNIYPEYITTGGYLKHYIVTEKDKQKWWNGLAESERKTIMALPNFDADKFYKCTGIRVNDKLK